MNWATFDRDWKFLDGGAKQLQGGAEDGTDVPFAEISKSIDIKEPGYVYIWLSNTSTQVRDVFFDDFKVVHTKSPVIQQEEYYPFGLAFNSYACESGTPNDYKYNGKEVQTELGLGWLDYGARMYTPELGRFFTPDRFAEKYLSFTPYQYGANSPLIYVDVNGDSLKLNNGGVEQMFDAFKEISNKGTGGYFETIIDEEGNVTLKKTAQEGTPTDEQQNYIDKMQSIIDGKMVKLDIVGGSPGVLIGSWALETIDMDDIKTAGSATDVVTQQGLLIHELTEQYAKQALGFSENLDDMDASHLLGTFAEDKVNGSMRVDVMGYAPSSQFIEDRWGIITSGHVDFRYKRSGSETTLRLDIIESNVIKATANRTH
ncbi:MAG: hypothetical protein DI539_26285 [Flavobacterium psychrophilum]|nr:MAG: hypothetical protein DI539_26285 [Flavobacterium psychrophilum]